ncbi:MAG: hypothetical protein KKF44_02660 [Nanoarchaeota archaeon]|nr:hypothetical protein [Nanoarchaeota archaeon]
MAEYKVVTLLDIDQLLTFVKNDVHSVEDDLKEERRVEKELKEFIREVEKHSGHKIQYIGHEKRYGRHLVRFIFKKGGFLEVIVEKPLSMNGHFINQKHAEMFMKGLKKVLNKKLPDHPVKSIFIESIKIEDGFKDDLITLDTWNKMHRITIHKTFVTTIVIFTIFVILELIKEYFKVFAASSLNVESVIFSVIAAILISVLFEPLKERIDRIVGKIIR